ncbi:MAG: DUF4293 domain-containing protein [Flavobacteriales bacterium]|nr:DUF4293 domain-containing protein [Flavobacteriales bacterium]MDG1797825.1 DUF4293 domain-containing protein [Flavobacteriales bacterium]
MIQRIQTVYILLFCIVIFAASFSPFATISTLENSTYTLLPTGWESQSSLAEFNTYPFFTSYLVSISFAILMLVNYKKRVKQLRYGKLCYFFTLLSFVVMFLEFNNALEIIKSENISTVLYSYGMYLLIACLPIMFLANRSIKKDDKLVKSLDRLR